MFCQKDDEPLGLRTTRGRPKFHEKDSKIMKIGGCPQVLSFEPCHCFWASRPFDLRCVDVSFPHGRDSHCAVVRALHRKGPRLPRIYSPHLSLLAQVPTT